MTSILTKTKHQNQPNKSTTFWRVYIRYIIYYLLQAELTWSEVWPVWLRLTEASSQRSEGKLCFPKLKKTWKSVECCLLQPCFTTTAAGKRDWLKCLQLVATHTMGSTMIKESATFSYLPAKSVPCSKYYTCTHLIMYCICCSNCPYFVQQENHWTWTVSYL